MNGIKAPHSQSLDELASILKDLGLSEVPKAPNTYPTLNPVDIYRSHLTQLLSTITGADPQVVLPALQWTQTLDKGDLVLPVPALRLKGKKPKDIAAEIGDKVL